MHESAISNGHRADSDIDLALTERFQRPQQIIDAERIVAGAKHSKPTRLGRFHEAVVTSSYCSVIFVLGIAVGVVWNR